MKFEGDQKWVDEHMDELAQYEGQMIAVVNCKVVAQGREWIPVKREAEAKGYSYPFLTKIEKGRHIDLYEIPGFTIIKPENQ